MHIIFSISVFIFVGLFETFRHGIFGVTPFEITAITAGVLSLCALVILRGDIVFTVRRPRRDLYGKARLNWTWPRTALGLTLGLLLWTVPAVFDFSLFQAGIMPLAGGALVAAMIFQVLLVALPEELFFREAAIKAFRGDKSVIYLVSGLAYFIYYIPLGVPTAMIMVGAGLYFLTLRLIGASILAVALIHGATSLVFTKGFSMGLTGRDEWIYAGYFLAAVIVMSAAIYRLFAQNQSEHAYA